MKDKANSLSIISIIFDLLVPIIWLVQALQQNKNYNINIFWIFFSMSLLSEGITEYRFGKPLNKLSSSYKYSRWFMIIMGAIMFTVSIVKLVLG
ncbi:hypothetical protein LL037_12645 [Clostridium estertheticum]|uniref:hypothetical protein n=1 Tax=Clostridium estertheticum TaxID=238834 RepID=UPI001C0CDC1C|nr:hypothetical protein [Clostridium estertheticum]MBU3200924.1 hypothetical protein [Clostridium estertheticum]WAG67928.1 hypothetical protein LL037_12645 [Clostridium estertheticum]